MTITAKFAGECPRCGHLIHKGEPINWTKGEPAIHAECPTYLPVKPNNVTRAYRLETLADYIGIGIPDEVKERIRTTGH